MGDTLSYKGQPLLSVGQACSPQNCKQEDPKVGWNSFFCGSPVATVVCPMPAPVPSWQVTRVKDSCPFTDNCWLLPAPPPSFISEPSSSPMRWDYHPHLTDEDSETHRDQRPYPVRYSWESNTDLICLTLELFTCGHQLQSGTVVWRRPLLRAVLLLPGFGLVGKSAPIKTQREQAGSG